MKTKDNLTYFLPKAEVLARVNMSDTTLYKQMSEGRFPLPIRVNRRGVRVGRPSVAWLESEIDQWLKDTDPLTKMERVTYKPYKKPEKKR